MITDSHAHLDFPDFSHDLDDVLARASAAGVTRIITIGTTIEGSRRALALAERFPNVWATVGVHPSNAGEASDDFVASLRELAAHPKVVAIGECGLDYYRLPSVRIQKADPAIELLGNESPADVEAALADGAYKTRQAEVFEAQLELAAELGLNIVVHQRDSWKDTVDLLRPYSDRVRAVFHCFGGSIDDANELFAMGHLVSFTGIITFKNAQLVQEAVRQIPADSFMVETDCPFLAPAPNRGKRCEPGMVRTTAEKLAELRNVSFETIASATEGTANSFFRFASGLH